MITADHNPHWTKVPVRTGGKRGSGHWLLGRRSLTDPEEIVYYACYGPRGLAPPTWPVYRQQFVDGKMAHTNYGISTLGGKSYRLKMA